MMSAVTYSNPEVGRYIEQHFIPVQFNVAEQPQVIEQLHSPWTPSTIIQDADGTEHRRAYGYLDPARFLGEAALARLNTAIERREFDAARDRSADALQRTHGDPAREPEALYWDSVVAYRASGDPKPLLEGWNNLLDRFPESEWAKRVEFLRH
jgi:hypothetical protein